MCVLSVNLYVRIVCESVRAYCVCVCTCVLCVSVRVYFVRDCTHVVVFNCTLECRSLRKLTGRNFARKHIIILSI